MPRHIRTFLLATLAVALVEALLFAGWSALAHDTTRAAVWFLLLVFLGLGISLLVYGSRQSEQRDRQTAMGASIVPFGLFLANGALMTALLIIDGAEGF